MTREEAIKSALKFLVRKQQEQGSWGYADNDDTNEVSWDEIIEWVDKQPCGDLIRRQELLKRKTTVIDDDGDIHRVVFVKDVEDAPSVGSSTDSSTTDSGSTTDSTTVEPGKCGDCISREAVLKIIADKCKVIRTYPEAYGAVKRLPPVEPERKRSEWIPVSERLPEPNDDVLVCYDYKGNKTIEMATYVEEMGFIDVSDPYMSDYYRKHRKAVAWMPLPEPYKTESEDKLDGDPIDTDKAVEHYEGTLETLKGIDLEVDR